MKTSFFKRKLFQTYALILCLLSLSFLTLYSQHISLNSSNSESMSAVVSYYKDHNGFWKKQVSHPIMELALEDSAILIGKINKQQTVYALSKTGIVRINLGKEEYKEYKKNKLIKDYKLTELDNVLSITEKSLDEHYQKLNQKRQRAIEDSLAEVERLEKLRLAELARIEALRHDSIRKAIRQAKEDSIYRETTPVFRLDLSSLYSQTDSYRFGSHPLKCIIESCDFIPDKDADLICMRNDTLIYMSKYWLPMGTICDELHAVHLVPDFLEDSRVKQHLRVWGDSLQVVTPAIDLTEMIVYNNFDSLAKGLEEVRRKAPNGFIKDWSWNDDYGMVSLNVEYMNTNKKTIKYIKFFFTLYNAVGDVRGRGSVQGTGPVEQFHSGRWDFDRTGCWAAGDVTTMKITKLLITYMNGATITLTGDNIKFDY